MNHKFIANTLKFVEVASVAVKRAMDEVGVHRQAQKRASDLRAGILTKMIKLGCANEQQKEGADAMLASHAETLKLFDAAMDKIAELKLALEKRGSDLGSPDSEKSASASFTTGDYDSLTDPFVGRKTSMKKASDIALSRVLEPAGR